MGDPGFYNNSSSPAPQQGQAYNAPTLQSSPPLSGQAPGYNPPPYPYQNAYGMPPYPYTLYPPTPPKVPGRDKAVASLICGCVSFILISLYGIGGIPTSIVGIVVGAQARKEMPEGARGLATAGLAVSITSLALSSLAVMFLIVFFALLFTQI